MQVYRMGEGRHPLWDGTGAAMVGGRWNSPGRAVIYGSLSYACCMLELLAHANIGRVPGGHRFVSADVPEHLPVVRFDDAALPQGWDSEGLSIARAFGDQWLREGRSAVMLVPSVVARLEWNVVINPAHADAQHIRVSDTRPVVWDQRLFTRLAG